MTFLTQQGPTTPTETWVLQPIPLLHWHLNLESRANTEYAKTLHSPATNAYSSHALFWTIKSAAERVDSTKQPQMHPA